MPKESVEFANKFVPRKIVFESVNPHDWFVVKFPSIHDESRNLEVWLDEVLSWVRNSGATRYTWGLVHGLDKKDKEITSPVLYFKDRFDALRSVWRFSGELQGEK